MRTLYEIKLFTATDYPGVFCVEYLPLGTDGFKDPDKKVRVFRVDSLNDIKPTPQEMED
jgi:hypothetical protein